MAPSVAVDGTKIRLLREVRLGMTRPEAASILGITTTALYYIERSRKRTSPTTLGRISRLLRIKPEALVCPVEVGSRLRELEGPELAPATR